MLFTLYHHFNFKVAVAPGNNGFGKSIRIIVLLMVYFISVPIGVFILVAGRRLLMAAIDAVAAGDTPPFRHENGEPPLAVDTICTEDRWRDFDRARRSRSPWAAKP